MLYVQPLKKFLRSSAYTQYSKIFHFFYWLLTGSFRSTKSCPLVLRNFLVSQIISSPSFFLCIPYKNPCLFTVGLTGLILLFLFHFSSSVLYAGQFHQIYVPIILVDFKFLLSLLFSKNFFSPNFPFSSPTITLSQAATSLICENMNGYFFLSVVLLPILFFPVCFFSICTGLFSSNVW